MNISDLLLYAQKNDASDLHLSADNPPILRIHGEMTPYGQEKLSASDIKDMLYSVMSEQQRTEFEKELDIDFAITFSETMRYRVNAYNNIWGAAAVFRSIPTDILTLEQLGAPAVFKRIAQLNKGLVLVTGPTGSGKSTTLAAIIHEINQRNAKHILTIEDPVEFVHVSRKSLINQREVGKTTHNFARALKSALREDPDVILVGELRDIETIQLALTAAETGHLVFATLHTNSAPETIDRVIDVFPPESKEMVRSLLSISLQAVITQTLLKSTTGGRVAAYELLLGTSAIRNLIREGKIPQIASLMQIGSKFGMQTMKDNITRLVDEGKVSEETAAKALLQLGKDDTADAMDQNNQSNEAGTRKQTKITNIQREGF